MVTTIINALKKKPLIWKIAKALVYTLLSLKAHLLTAWLKAEIKYATTSGVAAIKRKTPLVVSFTSYGHRISRCHITAQTLLHQSCKADRVILWLAHGEKITPYLQKLVKRGLEIQFCDDLRSYKKIIPALELYSGSVIVTADDDIIYPRSWLKKLWQEHLTAPDMICCHRAHIITQTHDGAVKPYNEWEWCARHSNRSAAIFPTSGGGALYPPESLHPAVTDVAMFQKLCPYADDIWLKAMSLMQGTVCRIVTHKPLLIPLSSPGTQTQSALRTINIDANQNDVQFKAVFTHYNLYKLLNR